MKILNNYYGKAASAKAHFMRLDMVECYRLHSDSYTLKKKQAILSNYSVSISPVVTDNTTVEIPSPMLPLQQQPLPKLLFLHGIHPFIAKHLSSICFKFGIYQLAWSRDILTSSLAEPFPPSWNQL